MTNPTSEVGEYAVVRSRLEQEADNRSAQICMRYLDGSIERPTLLAALLENAGAVKVGLTMDADCVVTAYGMDGEAPDVTGLAPDEGEVLCLLLSIPEGAEG